MLISGISHAAAKKSQLAFASNKVSATSWSESKDKLVSEQQFNAMIVLRSDKYRNEEHYTKEFLKKKKKRRKLTIAL